MLPLIFCGDFNFTPRSFPYACITCGSHALDPSSPHVLQHKKEIVAGWHAPDLQPMASVYAAVNGAEPDYTNNCVQLGNYFCDTLDYIFTSARVQGRYAPKLPTERQHTQPSKHHPSDHLPVVVDVDID
jgi:endonuclease/exonuclease/phosphatase family metal-dependent hydrolase